MIKIMNSWRRIVFLDIDGCVNSEQYYVKTKGRAGDFDPEAIELLNQLEIIGAEVVVSSTWGEDGVEQLKNVGLKLPILGTTKKLHYQFDWACRGNEIDYWLTQNFGGMGTCFGSKYQDQDYEYVIFDDDMDMLLGQKDNFIQIDRQTGITQADIDKAIKILKREN